MSSLYHAPTLSLLIPLNFLSVTSALVGLALSWQGLSLQCVWPKAKHGGAHLWSQLSGGGSISRPSWSTYWIPELHSEALPHQNKTVITKTYVIWCQRPSHRCLPLNFIFHVKRLPLSQQQPVPKSECSMPKGTGTKGLFHKVTMSSNTGNNS